MEREQKVLETALAGGRATGRPEWAEASEPPTPARIDDPPAPQAVLPALAGQAPIGEAGVASSGSAVDTQPAGRLPGILLRAAGSRFGDRVYYCWGGRRHWVADGRWLGENGFCWPDDVAEVSPDFLEAFLPGRLTALRRTASDWAAPPAESPGEMRELLVSRFKGRGFEIGAGSSPLAIPLECDVRYIDMYDAAGLAAQTYEGQQVADLVRPDIQASFDDLGVLEDEGADFLAACHVIEHTRSPIRSIFDAYRKLRPGGQLALVVPEMTRTFDRHRELTRLDHLIEDFHRPDHQRDAQHFREFYSRAFVAPPETFEPIWRQKWEEQFPIHYHTWTHDSFAVMIRYMSENLCRFDEIWSHPVLQHPDSNEFYFVMRKPR